MTFRLDWLELRCPQPSCRADLEAVGPAEDPVALSCSGCGHRYPVIFGIPDLRIFPDPYISFEGDRGKAEYLVQRFAGASLRSLAVAYYHITPETPPEDVERNLQRLEGAVARAGETLGQLAGVAGGLPGEHCVEIGCGSAPLLLAARDRYAKVAGVDVALRWLIIAKRRLADSGITAPLVAACGEALPFGPASADVVLMDSSLESTRSPSDALLEAHRILRPSGHVAISTPNRWSIGPDPHIGLPAGSWLPRPLVDAIAKQRMARPPVRHLYSAPRLAAALRQAAFADAHVVAGPVATAQLDSLSPALKAVALRYNHLLRTALGRQLGRAIGPVLFAAASRA